MTWSFTDSVKTVTRPFKNVMSTLQERNVG